MWSRIHTSQSQPTCVQACRVAVLSGVQCIPYCVQRAKYANVCTFNFLVAVPFDNEQSVQNVRWQAGWELIVISAREGNAQCITESQTCVLSVIQWCCFVWHCVSWFTRTWPHVSCFLLFLKIGFCLCDLSAVSLICSVYICASV